MKVSQCSMRAREQWAGILFTLPVTLGLLLFMAYPLLASFYYSFCNYPGLKPPVWVGLENYRQMLRDPLVSRSLANTAVYAATAVPLGIVVAFVLAMLLNQKVRGISVFRTIFYLPSIVPAVAGAVLWLWVFNPQYGLLNGLLGFVGINGPGWMADPAWAKPALVLMSTWGVGGMMIIFLAGLQDVPREMYEAAEIDGASDLRQVWHITLPFMSPHIFFALVMGLIGASQYFTQAYVMTNGAGSPANSTLFFALYLFQNAFHFFKMGYACAMAWLLFLITLGATFAVFASSSRYVFYQGESK